MLCFRRLLARPMVAECLAAIPMYGYGKSKGKRSLTPHVLRDPKFTRFGVGNLKAKEKNYKYDLSSPHIRHPHLYYNLEADKKIEFEKKLIQKKLADKYQEITGPDDKRDLKLLIAELHDKYLMQHQWERIIHNIDNLHLHYPDQVSDNFALIQHALKMSVFYKQSFNFLQLRKFQELCLRYLAHDTQSWRTLSDHLAKLLIQLEYRGIQPLQENEEQVQVLIQILTSFCQQFKRLAINTIDLQKCLSDILIERLEDIKNPTQKVQMVILLTTIIEDQDMCEECLDLYLPKINKDLKNIGAHSMAQLAWVLYKKQIEFKQSFLDNLISAFSERVVPDQEQENVATFSLAMSRMPGSLSTTAYQEILRQKLLPIVIHKYNNVHDLAAIGEALKKYGETVPAFTKHLEDVIGSSFNSLHPKLILQILYSATERAPISSPCIKKLINQFDRLMRENEEKFNSIPELELAIDILKQNDKEVQVEALKSYLLLVEQLQQKMKEKREKEKPTAIN